MDNNTKNYTNIEATKIIDNNTSKIFITVFIIISVMIIILLIVYYASPNNYIIEEFKDDNFNIMNTEKITMEPKSEILLDYYTNKNYFIKIKSKKLNKLNMTYSNTFKSQNVKLKSNHLLKSNFYSNLKIKNNSKHKTIVTVKYYTKINKRN